MGSRGPVPKRSDQRHGHRKADPASTAPTPQAPFTPPAAKADWHHTAKQWYWSLKKSGQAVWYQPSDWMYAYVWADLLSRQLQSDKPSAMMLAAWNAAAASLLVTEGDRRRVRIELERAVKADPDKEAGVASMQAWREKLAGEA